MTGVGSSDVDQAGGPVSSSQTERATNIRLTLSRSIYRRALKLTLAWTIERGLWRGQALYIRSLFEAKKDVREPRQLKVSVKAPTRNVAARLILYLQALILEAEDLLDKWKHPEPYRPPTAPGGMSTCSPCYTSLLYPIRLSIDD